MQEKHLPQDHGIIILEFGVNIIIYIQQITNNQIDCIINFNVRYIFDNFCVQGFN